MAFGNTVMVVGNATRDPELRFTPSGSPVCTFGLAWNRRYERGGEQVEETSFFDVTCWSSLAENVAEHGKSLGHARAHVERVVVVDDQDTRGVRRGLVLEGLYLVKVIDEGRVFPDCLIQSAVDDRRGIGNAADFHGLHGRSRRFLAQGTAALDEDA